MSTMALPADLDPNFTLEEPHPLPVPPPLDTDPLSLQALVEPTLPQPSLPSVVYGVRRGKDGVRGCIFLLWEDCASFVEGCDSEYESFSNLAEAAHYALGNRNSNSNDGKGDSSCTIAATLQALPAVPAPVSVATALLPATDVALGAAVQAAPTAPLPDPPTAGAARPTAPAPPAAATPTPTAKKKRTPSTAPKAKRGKTSFTHTRASKYWMEQYELYKQHKDNPNITDAAIAKKVAKFEKEQRLEYLYMQQDKETKMIQDKINKLEDLNFDFQYHSLLQQDTQKWDTMLQEFKAYQKVSDSTSQPKQSTTLRDWKHAQRVQFQNLQEGKRSTLTPDRIRMLNDAGFVFCPRSSFRTMKWEERIDQLQKYKEENGHLNIPTNHPELGYFTSNIRRAYKYLREGKKTGFTEEKAVQLTAMGFSFLVGKRKTGPIEYKSWDEQFQLLVDFKSQFGHTVVPQHYPGLGRFVKQMRREFKLMKEGKRSTMTPEKVLKLADIGFVFDAKFRRGSKISTNDFTKVGGKKRGDQGG